MFVDVLYGVSSFCITFFFLTVFHCLFNDLLWLFEHLFTFFFGVFWSSSLQEASETHLAPISACSGRANSLYEVLPGVLRLVDRLFTVFYVAGPLFTVFLPLW